VSDTVAPRCPDAHPAVVGFVVVCQATGERVTGPGWEPRLGCGSRGCTGLARLATERRAATLKPEGSHVCREEAV
jgi:hypothetical protein